MEIVVFELIGVTALAVALGMLIGSRLQAEAFAAGEAKSKSVIDHLAKSNELATEYHDFARKVNYQYSLLLQEGEDGEFLKFLDQYREKPKPKVKRIK